MADSKGIKQPEDIFAEKRENQQARAATQRTSAPMQRPAPLSRRPSPRWIGIGVIILGVIIIAGVAAFVFQSMSEPEEVPPTNTVEEPTILPDRITVPTSAPDADGDGLSDAEEQQLGTRTDVSDSDADNLFDREEVKIYQTDPLKSDSDGDGTADGAEVTAGTNPAGAGLLRDLDSEIQKLNAQ